MNILYWVYVNVFWCLRRVHKILGEEKRPIELEVHNSKWLSVDATFADGTTKDVTEIIRDSIRSDTLLTPNILERVTRLDNVESWAYLTTALEYNKITADGIVNGL